jgi:hypothetical protein
MLPQVSARRLEAPQFVSPSFKESAAPLRVSLHSSIFQALRIALALLGDLKHLHRNDLGPWVRSINHV